MKNHLRDAINDALDTMKKNGDKVFDQNNLEVNVAGTYAGDKFIVIRQKEQRYEKEGHSS